MSSMAFFDLDVNRLRIVLAERVELSRDWLSPLMKFSRMYLAFRNLIIQRTTLDLKLNPLLTEKAMGLLGAFLRIPSFHRLLANKGSKTHFLATS